MKIINQTYRNVLTDELLNKTPVSELQETKALYEQSLIHIVQHIEGTGTESKYESMKMTIKAARTKKREDIYRAAMLDPHTAAELNIDDIVAMCDELIDAHGDYMKMYR